MPLSPIFYTKAGHLRPYAFACGYVEKHTIGSDTFTLGMEHRCYHFKGFLNNQHIWLRGRTLTDIRSKIADLRRTHKAKQKIVNPKHIKIEGRRWFDKVNGNTYHTARILLDGVESIGVGYSYGYDQQYVDSAFSVLEGANLIRPRERYQNGVHEPIWEWAERMGVKVEYSAVDVNSRGGLHAWKR